MKRGPKPTHFGCLVEGCPRDHEAGGYCRAHYLRVRKHGSPQADRPLGRPPVISAAVVDVLVADGGWLTAEGIQLVLPQYSIMQVREALGGRQVESRRVDLATGKSPLGYETRTEWRAK